MADWKKVRFDPAYEEKLDPEITPLCDALNESGFVTVSSCCGHGYMWPHVWFEHSTDGRIERLARFVKSVESGAYFSMWQKEILAEGYIWSVEVHLNNLYKDTPVGVGMQEAMTVLASITQAVRDFAKGETMKHEVFADKVTREMWRVEAINHANEGECFVTSFSGPNSQQRAEEYAAWKNL